MTGGMATKAPPFGGSERLHADGRPRKAFRDALRQVPNVRNVVSVVGVLVLPVTIIWTVVSLSHPLAWAAAFPLMAIAQNRLFIIHHEAAHRVLFSNRRLNDLIGINLLGLITFGSGSHGYRIGHLQHHRDEFGPNEPDFLLYSLYPVSKASMRRKLVRDALGVSAFRILRPRFSRLDENLHRLRTASFLGGQAFTFALFALAGHPWLYPLLWLAPWIFVYQVLNRLRAIAEHGGMTRSGDRRNTTHHVQQSWPSRLVMVPYGVGYHVAHHVDMSVPWRNLHRLHRALVEDGYLPTDRIWPDYRSLWRALRSGNSRPAKA
jgi:fatty acid desaturase